MPPKKLSKPTSRLFQLKKQLERKTRELDDAIATITVDDRPSYLVDAGDPLGRPGKGKGKKFQTYKVIQDESEAEPESSRMAMRRPRAVPKSKLLIIEDSDDVENEKSDKEEEEDDEDAVVVRRPVRREKLPVKVIEEEGYSDDSEPFIKPMCKLALGPSHKEISLESPPYSPPPPSNADDYDIGWLLEALPDIGPETDTLTNPNGTSRDLPGFSTEIELIDAMEKHLGTALVAVNFKKDKLIKMGSSIDPVYFKLAAESHYIEKNLSILQKLKTEREEYRKERALKEKEDRALERSVQILKSFKAERENSKLRPKVQSHKSPSPQPQVIPLKRGRGRPPKLKPKAQSSPQTLEDLTEARELEASVRLMVIRRMMTEKQLELADTMSKAERLHEELTALQAEEEEMEKIWGFDKTGVDRKDGNVATIQVLETAPASPEVAVQKLPTPPLAMATPDVIVLKRKAASPQISPIQISSSSEAGYESESDFKPKKKKAKRLSQSPKSPTVVHLLTEKRRRSAIEPTNLANRFRRASLLDSPSEKKSQKKNEVAKTTEIRVKKENLNDGEVGRAVEVTDKDVNEDFGFTLEGDVDMGPKSDIAAAQKQVKQNKTNTEKPEERKPTLSKNVGAVIKTEKPQRAAATKKVITEPSIPSQQNVTAKRSRVPEQPVQDKEKQKEEPAVSEEPRQRLSRKRATEQIEAQSPAEIHQAKKIKTEKVAGAKDVGKQSEQPKKVTTPPVPPNSEDLGDATKTRRQGSLVLPLRKVSQQATAARKETKTTATHKERKSTTTHKETTALPSDPTPSKPAPPKITKGRGRAKVAVTPKNRKNKVQLKKEMSDTIDDLQQFFGMTEYQAKKAAGASKA